MAAESELATEEPVPWRSFLLSLSQQLVASHAVQRTPNLIRQAARPCPFEEDHLQHLQDEQKGTAVFRAWWIML